MQGGILHPRDSRLTSELTGRRESFSLCAYRFALSPDAPRRSGPTSCLGALTIFRAAGIAYIALDVTSCDFVTWIEVEPFKGVSEIIEGLDQHAAVDGDRFAQPAWVKHWLYKNV